MDRFKDYDRFLTGQMGYYSYFVLLADRFLEKGGRMALVLPASVLRVKSCEGLRQLWSEKYHVEHIILTSFRSAFSESTKFREMLLVAKKVSEFKAGLKTKLVMLKDLPKTQEEARNMAQRIRSYTTKNGYTEVTQVDYSVLRDETRNWFRFFALRETSLLDEFTGQIAAIPTQHLGSLTPVVRGYEMRGGLVQSLVVYGKPSKARKSKDIWIQVKEDSNSIIFRHRASDDIVFTLPISAFAFTIRRSSGLKKLNVSGDLDYIVTDISRTAILTRFKDAIGMDLSRRSLESLRKDMQRRLGNFFISADFDLSAPGTHWISFYSSTKVAPSKLLWSMNMDDDDAKILCLFFNSSLNIVQVLAERAETRGAFMRLREYIVKDLVVPHVSRLETKVRSDLVSLFDSLDSAEVPSILEQLRTGNSTRKHIDVAWLKVLGYKGNMDSYLNRLYSSLVKEIEILEGLMTEGSNPDESTE
jgi:hypothetical protein